MSILYLECESGISGDMAVAALLDLGASEDVLRAALASLPVGGFSARVSRVSKAGLDACDFDVELDAEHENRDHDMAYLHGRGRGAEASDIDRGHGHGHGHGHHRGHEHGHAHEHAREHGRDRGHEHENVCEGMGGGEYAADAGHAHHHEHRALPEIEALIDAAAISPRAKATAKRIFGIVADAEAKAHGVPRDQVHFHEVGAVDSIVDIVAVSVCLDDLGIEEAAVGRLCEGRGTVRCQHGVLPVPVPAVVNIAQAAGLPLHIVDVEGELVTPTGAAIAAAVRTRDALPERFTVRRVGLGAGKRAYSRPSILRAMLIDEASAEASHAGTEFPKGCGESACSGEDPAANRGKEPTSGASRAADPAESSSDAALDASPSAIPEGFSPDEPLIWKLETEVDDCTGEALGFALDALYAAGAREAHFLPVFMKKNRPGYQIQVVCSKEDIEALENVLFEHTTTIGVRRCPMGRTPLPREPRDVETPYGPARSKAVVLPDGAVRAYPEHDSVAALAASAGVSYQEAYRAVLKAL